MVAGRYRLTSELGRGGMGVVWQADDELIGRQVAIKELRAPEGLAPADHEEFAERALSEARNAARVRHPGAVTLYDVIPAAGSDDAIYLIMELIHAPTLSQLLSRGGPLHASRAAGIGVQLLDVLDAAHALGVVHRDVKPANVMIESGDRVRLTDFGIAAGLDDPRLTRSGVMGTQAYMAPELFDLGGLSPAIDLWSLGATLYRAVAGTGPFERQSTAATLRAILFDDLPVPPCGPPLATAISGLLVRDPARRATSEQVRPLLRQAASMTAASAAGPARTAAQPPSPAPPTRPFGGPVSPRPSPGAVPGPRPIPVPSAGSGPPLRSGPPAGSSAGAMPPPVPGGAWGMPGPGRPAPPVPAWSQRTAPVPGIPTFSRKPGIFPGTLVPLPRAVLACIGLLVTVVAAFVGAGIVGRWSDVGAGFFFIICVLGGLTITMICMASTSRWWTLQFTPAGMVSCTGRKRGGVTRRAFIPWQDITWVGPYSEGYSTYLGVRSRGINGGPGLPVPVCPLGTRDFPVPALREAIIRYCPSVNLDPQLQR
jgi:tRNA A-37 threonylcarbamoyl transferase component Bud32